ncbi:MAG TPA: hypothetical protein VHZ55_11285 [Bryobacteraceae bacterium]|jgi:hypothetical protein|nr:hypothetical protein [Bryobacteraceae bacterium]
MFLQSAVAGAKAQTKKRTFIPFTVGSPHVRDIAMNRHFDPYLIRRERIGLKLDALCEQIEQLALTSALAP